eukprot:jgi/Botrbrau1/7672/Bobra.0159s0114.1
MADAPMPDEYAVPPPDDEDDADSRDLSSLGNDADAEVVQPHQESDDDEGEDLLENAEQDYRPMPALDRYDDKYIDDNVDDGEMSFSARQRAERELDRRDIREGRVPRRRRLPGALEEDLSEDDRRPTQRRRIDRAQAGDDSQGDWPELAVDLETARGNLREIVEQEPVQQEIHRRFVRFLQDFRNENGELVYRKRIQDMCSQNKQSLEVEWAHVSAYNTLLVLWSADQPKVMLGIFHKAALEAVLDQFPDYTTIHQEVFVRFLNLPLVDSIRDLRQFHLNRLVRVKGVCTRRTAVYPQLDMIKMDCLSCGYVLGPLIQNGQTEVKAGSCPNCQKPGPFQVNVQETVYRNYQKITVQESPGSVPAGRLPRQKDVILLHDLVDIARPGEMVDITGVYVNSYDQSLNVKNGFPVFNTLIEANYVGGAKAEFILTDEDKAEIHRLARDPRIGERICKSMAPSIFGHANIKMALALALFGGQEKNPPGSHRLRGDINVLLLGDPGTAKSQFLKYIEKVAQRAIYTTGKGASAVGLTASVQKDPITREWTLEGGALVLADKGVCLIDEFDKMNDQDRVSIHEAMEQQSISISKAGIVTSLHARCSVIAAANPVGGRYDPSRTLSENVELSDPIISRFDVLCVVRDTVDLATDEKLADFVVGSHIRAHPTSQADSQGGEGGEPAPLDPDMLSQDLLRKYIDYAKQHCHPKLQNADYDKISQVYADLRKESAISHGMPIAVRHLESIIRMSEAHAAMHLREYVNDDDVDMAIRVLLESFISTQKMSVQKALSNKFKSTLPTRPTLWSC